MELDKFVSETLKAIIKGTSDAMEFALEHNAGVNPLNKNQIQSSNFVKVGGDLRTVTKVNFDIAVTASQEKGAKVGGGIKVIDFFNFKSDYNAKELNKAISKVNFDIDVVLPTQKSKND